MPTFLSKTFKVIFGIAIALLVLLIVFVAALPALLSKPEIQAKALLFINNNIPGCIEVEHVALSWFDGQKIEGFKLKDQAGKEIITFDSFSTEQSLFSALFGRYNFKNTTLINPVVHYVVEADGDPNIEKALSLHKKKRKKRALPKIRGDLSIVNGKATLESPTTRPIEVSEINVELKEGLFHLTAKTEQSGNIGDIKLSGNLGDELHLLADVKNFPVALADELKGRKLFTTALGNKLDFNGEFVKREGAIHLNAKVDSVNLKGEIIGNTKNGVFTIDPTSKILFLLTPAFFDETFNAEEWSLANKAQISLKLEEFAYTLNTDDLCLVGTLEMERAELSHENLGNFSLNDFAAHIDTKRDVEVNYSGQIQSQGGSTKISGVVDFDKEKNFTFTGDFKGFPSELLEIVFPDGKRLPEFIGSQLDLTFQGSFKNKKLDVSYHLSSLLMDVSGQLFGEDLSKLTLTSQGEITIPERARPYVGDKADFSMMANLPKIHARIKNPHLDVEVTGHLSEVGEPFDYEEMELILNGKVIDPILPEAREAFKEGTLFVHVDGKKNLILAKIDLGNIQESGRPELHASAQVENYISGGKISFKEARVLVGGMASDFPSDLLNVFLKRKIPFSKLFGQALKLQFEGQYTPKREEHLAVLDLEATGEGFSTNFSVILNEELHVSQDEPSYIHWEMTPERYQTLQEIFGIQGKSRYVLGRTASIELVIKDFVCPTPPHTSVSMFLCQSGFIGDLWMEKLEFHDPETKERITFPRIEGTIKGQDFSKAIYVFLKGNIESPIIPPEQKAGFYFDGEMLDFWRPTGQFNREKLKVKGEMHLDLLPVKEVLGLLPISDSTRQSTRALLGPLLNGRIYGEISELSGPLSVDLKSSNFKAFLPMKLDRGTLYLTQTIEAEITLTQEVSEAFLRDINPLFIKGATSDRPIKLYIDAQNFMVPLRPFSLSTVRVETAVIDLGKVRVQNGGDLSSLMTFIKVPVSPDGMMEAWFTPIYLNLQNGVATYRRFDLLLAGNIHLAFWGQIDLVNDRVDLTLGVGEETLRDRFNLKGMKNSDMFQLKMGGTTSHLSVDWDGAVTRIGILVAKSTAGGLGALVGGILETVLHPEQAPTPPPTTSPFPWQK